MWQTGKVQVVAVILSVVLTSIPALAKPPVEIHEGKEVVANQVLVKFKATHSMSTALHDVKIKEDIDIDESVGGVGARKLHSRSKNVETLLARLNSRPDIEYAEPDYIVSISSPNDPYFSMLWGLQNTGQTIEGVPGVPGADISAVPAWSQATGSTSYVVAVVDTGTDYNHQDLAANMWCAPTAFQVTVGGTAINCAAGTHGFNAITKTCDPMDNHYHGTHVSGTVGARGNNGIGVTGVNQVASIMSLKFLGSDGTGSISDAINAIDFAIKTKAYFGATANVRILSNSYSGGSFTQSFKDEINLANNNNILFVAAAGNGNPGTNDDTYPVYPASYNTINEITVASTNNTDHLSSFSNYGPTTVHLGAPGENIASTFPTNQYAYRSGTSMATPHVSGAAALVLSKCYMNTTSLKSLLLNNVDYVSDLAGKTVTNGRLNVNRAMSSCTPPPPCPTGDITDNSVVDSADTYIDMNITIGNLPIDPRYLVNGDVYPIVNGIPQPDGKIDIRDALLIEQKAEGLIHFCGSARMASTQSSSGSTSGTFTINSAPVAAEELPATSPNSHRVIVVKVATTGGPASAKPIGAIWANLTYPTDELILSASDVTASGAGVGSKVAVNASTPGKVVISLVNAHGIQTGEFATFKFRVAEGVSPRLTNFSIITDTVIDATSQPSAIADMGVNIQSVTIQ